MIKKPSPELLRFLIEEGATIEDMTRLFRKTNKTIYNWKDEMLGSCSFKKS